jgi:hypothetical protein
MVKPLQQIMEQRCELMFHMHLSLDDVDNMDLPELEWTTGWLYNKLNPKKEVGNGRY